MRIYLIYIYLFKSCIVIDHLHERSFELLKLEIMKKVDKSEAAKLRQNEEGTLGNNKEKVDELIIANKELTFQKEEKEKHANGSVGSL